MKFGKHRMPLTISCVLSPSIERYDADNDDDCTQDLQLICKLFIDSFQVELIGSGGKYLDISVNVEARLRKSSEVAEIAFGQAVNLTTDMLDASKLAWLTGRPVILSLKHWFENQNN